MSDILSTEEIQLLYPNINRDIVNEGIRQAEDRLKDSLDTKSQLEQKSFILLGSYVTIQIAIFSVIAFLYKSDDINLLFFILLLSGMIFTVSSIFLVLSLKSSNYGTIGRSPDTWLRRDVLNGDKDTHTLTLAHILHGYSNRIETSIKSNATKSRMLNIAILLGAASPVLFIIMLLSKI